MNDERVIKFRVWDKEKSIMYYSNADHTVWAGGQGASVNSHNGSQIVNRDCVMQFTGLHDKNGVGIYEGDIITCDIIEREDHDDDASGKPLKVSWSDECAGFYPFIKASQWRSEVYDVTVIGNIYQNPELLKPLKITSPPPL